MQNGEAIKSGLIFAEGKKISGPRNVKEKFRQKTPMFYLSLQRVESFNRSFYCEDEGRRNLFFSIFK